MAPALDPGSARVAWYILSHPEQWPHCGCGCGRLHACTAQRSVHERKERARASWSGWVGVGSAAQVKSRASVSIYKYGLEWNIVDIVVVPSVRSFGFRVLCSLAALYVLWPESVWYTFSVRTRCARTRAELRVKQSSLLLCMSYSMQRFVSSGTKTCIRYDGLSDPPG